MKKSKVDKVSTTVTHKRSLCCPLPDCLGDEAGLIATSFSSCV